MRTIRRHRWARRWGRFIRSLWFVPTLFTLGAVGLFFLTSWLDRRWHDHLMPSGWAGWLELSAFAGGPGVAESLLSSIAGMWATIIGISFSVTLVTIQLTATKYIAQVLPLFERNRINQFVLGAYLATVTYALLVARTVRLEGEGYVPYIGVNVASAMAVGSIFLLILFVSNVVNFVRPQFFLEATLLDTERALDRWNRRPERWRVLAEVPEDTSGRSLAPACLVARRKAVVVEVALDELAADLRSELRRHGAEGRWVIHLAKSPGEAVHRGEPLAYVTGPVEGKRRERLAAIVRAAMETCSHAEPRDAPEVGIEALAGLTIKGAVQGDLDVTFEGVDCMFSLMIPLATTPVIPGALRLEGERFDVVLVRPTPDLVAKMMRELTVISEVALAPSLPFRLVTEGISRRFRGVVTQLLDEGHIEAVRRLLPHLEAWYQSAFFHMAWANGQRHLVEDLASMAIAARDPDLKAAVLRLLQQERNQLASDSEATEVLDQATERIRQSGNRHAGFSQHPG